tara:strand:- start:6 stop:4607 length:4602 start_codon:yes stop_codon:yes gene_type:complete
MNNEEIMNCFFENIQKNIIPIPENLRQNYINYEVKKLLNKVDTNYIHTHLNYFFEIKKPMGNYSLEKKEKIKYYKNESDIILIAQYYETDDKQRQKENDISLLNNILNDSISNIHLLNEKEYNLEHILSKVQPPYKNKVKQHIIEKRMTFHDGMAFANTFCKGKIIIISNLDIFFTPDLDICKTYDFTNLFCSLSRYELLHDYNFDGNNKIAKFIHNGTLGNPCIDSHDAWIFKSPIKMTPKSKIMLGSAGCDTIINYVYGEIMKYNVVNPIDSIITIHYHRERERDYRTQNNVRSHSGFEYNKDNSFVPDDYQHKYILHKEIVVCNEIESFCTFATKGAYKDLRLLLYSLELYHGDIPVFILCDKWVNDKIDEDEYNLKIYKRIDLEKYTDMNRKKMEEQNLFTEFLLKKADVIDYAMECYENTLFIDGDIVILNKLDLLIDKKYDVGLSPHHIFEESEKMFGKYNAGLMFIANKNITNNWRHLIKTRGGFDDQQSLDYFEEDFKVFKFDDSYNYGWWRLFQCENPQERLNLFSIDDTIYYEFNTLKCIHTHLYEKNDPQTIQFNKLILQMLEKVNHPMLKYINQSEEEIMGGGEKVKKNVNKTFDKINENIISLGNSCDGANILKYFNYQTKNRFFDFLWNEKRGLQAICEIIENDFLHFDKIENYEIQKNTIIAWEGTEISNKQINKYYEDVLFYHNKTKINNNDIDSFKRKIERTQTIMNSNEYKYFIYYRHFKLNDNINILVEETNNFCNLYKKKYNKQFLLISCIMVENNIDINILDNVINKLNNIKDTNCVYDYVYKTDDYDIEKTTISRNRWKIVLEKYINQSEEEMIEKNHILIKQNNENNENNENTVIEETKTIPKIIIPTIPRNDFWNHSGDTFRELVSMWSEKGYCNVMEENTKHVWLNSIGDILLYDRPTLDWLAQDSNIKCNKILFGNPSVPDNLKNNASNWIFWGRSPRKLEEFHNMSYVKFNERRLKSIFIGKIENQVQLNYRNIDFSKHIQLYVMHKPDEKYKYTQDEYLDLLRNSKFGLCLRGFGPKCNREIELMALGTVPIVETNVDMDNYYDSPQENVHYLRFSSPEDIELLINNCSEEKWTQMSLACREWYKKNASTQGSFKTTINIVKNMGRDKLKRKIKETEASLLESKKEMEIVDNTLETFSMIDNLKEVNDIEDKIIYDFGLEEKFDRPNLESFYNIKEIYDKHKNTHGDCDWNGVNTFERIQKKYIAKFDSVKINTDGVMYDNEKVYTLNNSYYNKTMIEKKTEFQEFGDDVVVFNCVQKWAYGYYHWLCEIFPRLFYIKLYIENNKAIFENKKIVLMLYYNNEFIRQYLEILNLKNVSICPYNYNIEYKCKCVFMMTPSYCGNPSRDSIMLVRKSIFMNNILVPKVNVVLKRTTNRIISNFEEMMTFLRNKYNNYEWIVFDDSDPKWKSMTNTIQLFSSAKLIIGAHGAGLSNMMFSSDKVKVIELHPTSCGNVCYWHLSHILGNTHNILPVKYKNDKEFDVELDKLDYTVDKLINDVFCSDNILF